MKKTLRVLCLVLVFTIVLGVIPVSAAHSVEHQTCNGYDIAILYDTDTEAAYQVSEAAQTCTLLIDKTTNVLTMETTNYRISLLGLRLLPETERYTVFLQSVEENGTIRASFVSQSNPSDVYEFDSSKVSAQFATAACGVGLIQLAVGICAAVLIYYLLQAATVTIGDVVYKLVSDVIDALKKYKSNFHYYSAIRFQNNVWIGAALNDNQAEATARVFLNSSTNGIFAVSASYARILATKVSPIKRASSQQIHGRESGYYYHYHPMKTISTQYHLHIWY